MELVPSDQLPEGVMSGADLVNLLSYIAQSSTLSTTTGAPFPFTEAQVQEIIAEQIRLHDNSQKVEFRSACAP